METETVVPAVLAAKVVVLEIHVDALVKIAAVGVRSVVDHRI